MKKYFLLALVVLTGIASSCKYDDDEVWDSVNNLADRVTALEVATKQLNSDIAALQSIVSALQKQVSVSDVETLADGYIIHFSDGTKAIIKNGKDGEDGENGADGKDGLNAPIINVAQEAGIYYWTITIDGETEWLTDAAGNKLAVSGAAGEDGSDGAAGAAGTNGNTPLLKVDSEGYWTVSYDNGSTYARVQDETGNDVIAEGKNGDSQFKDVNPIAEKDGYILITMADGKEYKLPMLAAVTYKDADNNEVQASEIVLTNNSPVVLTYDVPQLASNYSVEVLKQEGVTITVNENNKQLTITLNAGASVNTAKAVILFYDANQTITSVLTFK